ncbi:hypothetical protein [Cytobacillus gottheilii]|uniref:hypothetical protein n=1 Tax=Cytobacillus gottheilii TaxID=859144 RepID=UPI00082FA700|nr:hypothetical protein [Cytobacillus gottheilii]
MKFYGNEVNGKLVHVKQVYGSKFNVVDYGYIDFLGDRQYNIQLYYVLRKWENGRYVFKKTTSEGKANALLLTGWELIKEIGTNYVHEQFAEIIVIDTVIE